MKNNRREFIKMSGLAASFFSVFASEMLGKTFSFGTGAGTFGANQFQKLVGTDFTIYTEKSAESITLSNFAELSLRRTKNSNECFALTFELPGKEYSQDTYEIYHPSLGAFDIFMVPGKSENGTNLLVAVFNRI